MIVKMASILEKPTKVLWLKGPNKGKFDWMKMRFIKEWLRRDRDSLVLASKIAMVRRVGEEVVLKEIPQEGFNVNIETETIDNENWREVLFTTKENQLVVMSVPTNEELGMETHPETSQFIRIEAGRGKAIIGGEEYDLEDGSAVVVPSGIEHNIINTSETEELKIYTVYSPPHHPEDTIQKTKADE